MSVATLPRLMVAPNGARRSRRDHPALPITVAQTVDTALACHRAGADGLHAHVRDAKGEHTLDPGLYRELLTELAIQAPTLQVQITTEAVGRYSAAEQRRVVAQLQPTRVSVALGEMTADGDTGAARDFYHNCHSAGIGVQHILYDPAELPQLATLVAAGTVPESDLQLLFVLGRYSLNQQSDPADLQPFLSALAHSQLRADWGLCAFGQSETACLVAADRAGGHLRVGFENSLWHSDGRVALDNAERVQALRDALGAQH